MTGLDDDGSVFELPTENVMVNDRMVTRPVQHWWKANSCGSAIFEMTADECECSGCHNHVSPDEIALIEPWRDIPEIPDPRIHIQAVLDEQGHMHFAYVVRFFMDGDPLSDGYGEIWFPEPLLSVDRTTITAGQSQSLCHALAYAAVLAACGMLAAGVENRDVVLNGFAESTRETILDDIINDWLADECFEDSILANKISDLAWQLREALESNQTDHKIRLPLAA